jgi:hypothetical protein
MLACVSQVRAAACEALCATSTRLGVPLAELALCPSAYGKDLLKFLGIKMAEAPQILPELARILGLQDTELARCVALNSCSLLLCYDMLQLLPWNSLSP